ncbi:MAG: shikimate dehydrogenase [Pseudomonadota bacterium]
MTTNNQQADYYAVIGFPVKHSRSPVIHSVFARQTEQNMTYQAQELHPDDLEAFVAQFQRDGGCGLNVTAPHKSEVVRLVDELSEQAATAGAVNTLSFTKDTIVGDNTDGVGLIRDLTLNKEWPLKGKRLLILGAGGATRGITRPLLEQGIEELTIANRSAAKAVALAEHFSSFGDVKSARFSQLDSECPYDLIVNATSAGLDGETPSFPTNIIGADSHCYDLSYGTHSGPFLSWAKENGAHKTANGWGMLVEQAAEAFRIWRGVSPDTADVISRVPG